MASVTEYYPGPSNTEEYSTLAALKSAIQTHVLAKMVDNGIRSGLSATSSPPYLLHSSNTVNGSLPYFQFGFEDIETSDYVSKRIRYSSALDGMLDPFTWFPDIYAVPGLAVADWELVRSSGKSGYDWPSRIVGTVNASNLTRSNIASEGWDRVVYSHGPRQGMTAGIWMVQSYTPNVAEQEDGITRSHWSAYILGDDADDGTLGVTGTPSGFGENYSQVPQIITESSGAAVGWDEVKADIGGIKDGINNHTPAVTDIPPALSGIPWAGQRNTVTHIDDIDTPADSAYVPVPTEAVPMFAAPGALPALVSNPTSLLSLSSLPAIVTGALAALGTAAATILNTGWISSSLSSLADLASISTATSDVAGEVASIAPEVTRMADALERLADALEALEAELVEDLAADPPRAGILNAVELASQTSTELTLRAKGVEIEASTGSVEGM